MAGLPCLISVAAIDPGNLEVDLQAGMTLRYSLIWSLALASFVGFVLQTLCAQLTILTGMHLSQLCAQAYRSHPIVSRAIFLFAELSVVAFDIAEVVGTAFALQLLFAWPLWLGMIMSAVDTIIVLYLQRNGLSRVEIIIEGMLAVLAASLFYEFALSKPDAGAIARGALIPSLGEFPRQGALLAIGILGSVVMSHNLFLHSWLIKERTQSTASDSYRPFSPASSIGRVEWATADRDASLRYAAVEAAAIFVATFAVNAAVVSVSAALPEEYRRGEDDIGLKDAGMLLRNVLGTRWASTAWGIALLASGHAATVTGTLASQAVCEGFLGMREGENMSAGMVLMTRVVAILPALVGGLVAGERGADRLVVLSQVVLSLALPFAVVPIFKIWRAVRKGGRLLWVGLVGFTLVLLGNVMVISDIWGGVAEGGGVIGVCVFGVVVLGSLGLVWKMLWVPVEVSERDVMVEQFCAGEAEMLLGREGVVYS